MSRAHSSINGFANFETVDGAHREMQLAALGVGKNVAVAVLAAVVALAAVDVDVLSVGAATIDDAVGVPGDFMSLSSARRSLHRSPPPSPLDKCPFTAGNFGSGEPEGTDPPPVKTAFGKCR